MKSIDIHKYFNNELNGEYILLSEYIDTRTKIKIKHLKCGHIFEINLANFKKRKTKCEKCQKRTTPSRTRFRYEKYMEYRQEFIDICDSLGRGLLVSEILSSDNHYNIPSWNWFKIHCPNKQIKVYADFLEWCGVTPNLNISKPFITKEVLKIHNELNRYLTYCDIPFSRFNIEKYWGGIINMRKELNLIQVPDLEAEYEKRRSVILNDLDALIKKLGRVPTIRELKKFKGEIQTLKAFQIYFGTYNNAVLSLGYKPNCTHNWKYISNEQIINQYKEYIDEYGCLPPSKLIKEIESLPPISTVKRRFNCNWTDFIQSLGYSDLEFNGFYGKMCRADDGTLCLSHSERHIHNYFIKNNINVVAKEYLYRNLTTDKNLIYQVGNRRCDWILSVNNKMYIIEYWGLMHLDKYKEKHNYKINFLKRVGLYDNLISIYPKQLNQLDSVFSNFFNNTQIA